MFEQAISAMASVVVDPYLLGLIFATTILGVIIGVLPGLGATTGAALLLPFTLTMDPVHAIAVLAIHVSSRTMHGVLMGGYMISGCLLYTSPSPRDS